MSDKTATAIASNEWLDRVDEEAKFFYSRAEDGVDEFDHATGDMLCAAATFIRDGNRRITALEAENARLREDAGRYAWIRDNCYPHEYLHRGHSHVVVSVYLGDDDRGRAKIMHPGKETEVGIPSLDSAIDAARGEVG